MLQDSMNSWKAFSAFCWLWKFSLRKVVKMLEEVVVGWQEVRRIWQMRENLIAQFVQLLKHWWCDMQLGRHCHGEELGPFCWSIPAAGVAVFGDLITLLSIFFRCDSFAGIQKAVVNQTSSRPPNTDCDLFWCKFGFGKCFGTSQSSHWAGHHWLSYKIHFSSHITIWSRNGLLLLCRIKEDTSKRRFFFHSAHEAHT